jgi:hypothetical protein
LAYRKRRKAMLQRTFQTVFAGVWGLLLLCTTGCSPYLDDVFGEGDLVDEDGEGGEGGALDLSTSSTASTAASTNVSSGGENSGGGGNSATASSGGENSGGGGTGGSEGDGGSGGAPPVGPCGPIPATGLSLCWTYGSSVPASQYVGFAGGTADPAMGQTIQTVFFNPRHVNPTIDQPYVLYDLGNPSEDADIQLRPALFSAPGNSSLPGTWDCGSSACSGDGYVYLNGIEIGSYIDGIADGALSTVPHFDPPYLLNLKVDPL